MDERHMQHGRDWAGANPRGWLATEKYRGCRAYWDGATLWSRGGHTIAVPPEWAAELPPGFPLDGEVWSGRGPAGGAHEVEASLAVRHGRFTPRLRFLVFDAPGVLAAWPRRLAAAAAQLAGNRIVQAVGCVVVRDRRHLEQLFAQVARAGGEGLMLRSPDAAPAYEPGRTRDLLKVKLDPALLRGVVRALTPAQGHGEPSLFDAIGGLRRPLRLSLAV
jgi:DNA ligase-1